MARATMAEMIAEARRLANAGTADSVVGGVTYWTDDQLQDVLDRYRREVRRVAMSPLASYINGANVYKEYPIPMDLVNQRLERDGSGGGFAIRTSTGAVAPAYTLNWSSGMVTFADDTNGDTFYLDARVYNLFGAVADVYEAKASFVAGGVDWSSDNHSISASQEYAHYMAMAQKYRGMSGASVALSRRVRIDERH